MVTLYHLLTAKELVLTIKPIVAPLPTVIHPVTSIKSTTTVKDDFNLSIVNPELVSIEHSSGI